MAGNSRDLTEGPVWKGLAAMASPMMLGILAVLSVGLADAYFLSKIGGSALAAVGFIYPVTATITSVSIGLSAGANATVSQAIGRKVSDDDAARIGLHALGLGVCIAAAMALMLFLVFPSLFALLGASDTVLAEINAFMPWWCLSFPFVVVTMLINSLFRAHGDSKVSAAFMVFEAAFNIALTPLLIFGWGPVPGMGTAGAAIATLIARAVTATLSALYAKRRDLVKVCSEPFRDFGWSVKELGKVGAPAAFSNSVNPAGMAIVTAAVATVGDAAVGGFGAATRIQALLIVPMLALSSGIGPVVGQNWGANQYERASQGLQAALAFCVVYGVVIGIILIAFAKPLAGFLADGGEAAEYGATYLRVVGLSLFGYGFVVVTNAAMNARSKAIWSMGLSLGRISLIYIPCAWIGVSMFGYIGIAYAAALANVIAAVAALGAGWMTDLLRPKTLKATFA